MFAAAAVFAHRRRMEDSRRR